MRVCGKCTILGQQTCPQVSQTEPCVYTTKLLVSYQTLANKIAIAAFTKHSECLQLGGSQSIRRGLQITAPFAKFKTAQC